MNRRTFLADSVRLAGSGALLALVPAIAKADVGSRLELSKLLATIQIDLLFKNYESARQRALQLGRISQVDPAWFTYSDSFNIAVILFQLTPPQNRDAYIIAATTVLKCYPAMQEGGLSDNVRVVAAAAFALLQADLVRPVPLPRDQMANAAALLLVMTGAAPGPERPTWARAARAGMQRYPSNLLSQWAVDGITPRFAAAGVAVAGDWKTAAAGYQRMMALSIGRLDSTLARSGTGPVSGLAGLVAGATTFESEAATAIAMAGDVPQAIDLLEKARRNTLNARRSLPGATATDARALEARLTAAGLVVVQPVASILGAFALVSVRRGKTVQRFTAFVPDHGGFDLIARLVNTGTLHFVGKDGLAPAYQRIRKDTGKHQEAKLIGYCARASADAEALIGSAIEQALATAKIASNADILVVLPANLAILPLGLCRSQAAAQPLSQQYQLRFADSLTSAAAALDRAQHPASKTPTLELLGLDPRAANLAFMAFERACVASAFASDGAAGAAAASPWPEQGGYWHVASHGAWNFKDPGKSGIMLGDKQVASVDDILRLQLRNPPRLIFLSACETALINIKQDLDRFVGLPTAFLSAGAGGVIGSQWPVSDAASALVASHFYDEHLANRRTPAAALASTQRWIAAATADDLRVYVMDKVLKGKASRDSAVAMLDLLALQPPSARPFENPYFWGGYQLYGA